MIRNSFQLTPNVLRTNTKLFRYVFLSSPVTPIVPKRSPIFIEPLSVLPYGPRTLQSWPRQRLRPMINSGTWMPIMTPVHSGSNRLNRTRCMPFPLSCDTRLVQDSINRIQCISSILLPTNLYSLVPWYSSLWPSHTLRSFMDAISPSWPWSIFPLYGLTNPALESTLLNISHRIAQDTPLWSPCFSVTVNALKASSEDSNYAWSHGQRNRLLRSVITTLNFYDLIMLQCLHWVMFITSFIQWGDLTVNWLDCPWSWNHNH